MNLFKHYRDRKGYTVREAAAMFQVHASTWSRCETGKAEPPRDLLASLCDAYDVEPPPETKTPREIRADLLYLDRLRGKTSSSATPTHEALNVSRQTWHRWITGRVTPSKAQQEKIYQMLKYFVDKQETP